MTRPIGAELAALWVIGGAASYTALLAGAVGAAGYSIEAAQMDAGSHPGVGKFDRLDANWIAAAVLPLEEQQGASAVRSCPPKRIRTSTFILACRP